MIKSIFVMAFASIALVACNNLVQQEEREEKEVNQVKQNTIVGKWSLETMKFNDTILKAPGLTIYDFGADGTYNMRLYKGDKEINTYKGKYNYDAAKKMLITDYDLEGPQHDEAKVVVLTDTDLHLANTTSNDTLLFKAYKK